MGRFIPWQPDALPYSPCGTRGEVAWNQQLRLWEQVRMWQQAHLLILGRCTFYLLPSLVPLVPSKHVLQLAVSDWLSLSASPISGLSDRIQFSPHVEEAGSAAAQPHSLFTRVSVEAVTALAAGPFCSSYSYVDWGSL